MSGFSRYCILSHLASNAANELVFHGDQRRVAVLHMRQRKVIELLDTELQRIPAQRFPRFLHVREVCHDVSGAKIE
jgi:hypothetical protein